MSEEIAKHADFFPSVLTTSPRLALASRDDALSPHSCLSILERKIVKTNPFANFFDKGCRRAPVRMGVGGWSMNPNPHHWCLRCETGGDPESIHMYYNLVLDHVSCSP